MTVNPHFKHSTLFLMVVLPLVVIAGKNPIIQPKNDEELPDADLLEFIAEFEPLEDQWIDPIQLNTIFAEKKNGKDSQ